MVPMMEMQTLLDAGQGFACSEPALRRKDRMFPTRALRAKAAQERLLLLLSGGTGRPLLIAARILFVDGDKLQLEFEVPDGVTLEMPGGTTPIVLSRRPAPDEVRRSQDRARCVETDSTRPSTYGPGLTLRLALEGQDWKRRLAAGPLFVAWETADWLIILAIE